MPVRRALVPALVALLASVLAPRTHAREEAPAGEGEIVEVLRLDETEVVRTTARGEDAARIARLADGDLTAGVRIAATPEAPLEIVYAFGGKDVSLESVHVHLPAGDPDAGPTASVELLASTVSAHAGFRSVRVCNLRGTAKNPRCEFMQVRARWVMLRITPAPGADAVEVAEVSVGGHRGAPASRYAFKQTPARAIEVLARLKRLIKAQVSEDERSLFEDAADGKLETWSFAEAALIASGVTDRAKRAGYLERLAKLEAEARKAVAGASTPYARGEKLLAWLHETPMSRGYVKQQTDLATLLDTGTYNCVSSATIYNILGTRLGLDLRAIEVPDHAFSILYEGTRHADVEVTTPNGFNPSRDPAARKAFEERTGFRYIPDKHPESRREVGAAGLVAIIYYNHAIEAADAKRFDDALLKGFCALSLDPEFGSAVKNVLAALANWSVHLAESKRSADAIAVLSTGLELAPTDTTLLNNRAAVWQAHIDAAVDAGRPEDALTLVRTAHAQVPGAGFDELEAWIFLKRAEELIDASRWSDAIALAEAGRESVGPKARTELETWRAGAYVRWGNQHLAAKAYGPAIGVIEKGLRVAPDHGHLRNNLAYAAQEWSLALLAAGKGKEAQAELLRIVAAHPTNTQVRATAAGFVGRWIDALVRAAAFEEAAGVLEGSRALVTKADDRALLVRTLYDGWARRLSSKAQHAEALEIYERGLGELPGDAHLVRNRRVIAGRLVQAHMKAGAWIEAATVLKTQSAADPQGAFEKHVPYLVQEALRDVHSKQGAKAAQALLETLLGKFPAVAEARAVGLRHFQRAALAHVEAGRPEEALGALEAAAAVLGKKAILESARIVYDRWADGLVKAGKWSEATAVYAKALAAWPGDAHLTQNASFTWHRWSMAHIEKKQWDEAIEVLERALERFPDNATFKNNLAYARQQKG